MVRKRGENLTIKSLDACGGITPEVQLTSKPAGTSIRCTCSDVMPLFSIVAIFSDVPPTATKPNDKSLVILIVAADGTVADARTVLPPCEAFEFTTTFPAYVPDSADEKMTFTVTEPSGGIVPDVQSPRNPSG